MGGSCPEWLALSSAQLWGDHSPWFRQQVQPARARPRRAQYMTFHELLDGLRIPGRLNSPGSRPRPSRCQHPFSPGRAAARPCSPPQGSWWRPSGLAALPAPREGLCSPGPLLGLGLALRLGLWVLFPASFPNLLFRLVLDFQAFTRSRDQNDTQGARGESCSRTCRPAPQRGALRSTLSSVSLCF